MEDSRNHWPQVSEAPPIKGHTLHAYDAPRLCTTARNRPPATTTEARDLDHASAPLHLQRPSGLLGKLLSWLHR